MITKLRVRQIARELEAAGDEWKPVARELPEFAKLKDAVPLGPGYGRAWVLLDGEHETYPTPVRLIRHEDGDWFLKGERH